MKKATFKVTKKDLEVTWFNPGQKGGQNSNRHNNCCRIKHIDTGIIVTATKHKERRYNQKDALRALAKHPKFLFYCDQKLREIEEGIALEEKIEIEVDKLMEPDNIQDVDDKDFRLLIKGKKKSVIDGVEIYE